MIRENLEWIVVMLQYPDAAVELRNHRQVTIHRIKLSYEKLVWTSVLPLCDSQIHILLLVLELFIHKKMRVAEPLDW